ncbi:ATP-grasp domain-containing protein [Thiotrichales bacterium 19S11-10]|nr:ATP-grasp domain-containing protein [Thiotrichales bacterium 19S11-10]
MKKNIVILSSIGLKAYDFSKFKEGFNLTLIIDELEYNNISKALLSNFRNILVSKGGHYIGPIVKLNLQSVIEIINNYFKKITRDNLYVINTSEANTFVASKIREYFDLSGMRSTIARRFTDKESMKKYVKNTEVKVPKSLAINPSYSVMSSKIGNHFIIKPTEAAASYGVEKITSQIELDNYLSTYKPKEYRYISEEFIHGTMYHCDIIISNGYNIFQACSEYLFPNLAFKQGNILSSLPLISGDIKERLIEASNKCLKSLEAVDGIYHIELFIDINNNIYFLEVGARIPAATVVKMYEVTYGINIADLSIKSLVNSITPNIQQELTGKYYFWAYLPKRPGIVKALKEPKFNSKFKVDWEVSTGQKLSYSKSIIDRVGLIYVENSSYEIIKNDFMELKNYDPVIYN